MSRQKRGAIWVSAVLYLIMGILVLSILLSAALPLIGKIKDRNTVLQTKQVLMILDETIKTVANEGPGSQRELSPLTIAAGKLMIDDQAEKISWSLETRAELQQPDLVLHEGPINSELQSGHVEGKYTMELSLVYTTLDIKLSSSLASPFTGEYNVLIKHTGKFTSNKPEIEIIIK